MTAGGRTGRRGHHGLACAADTGRRPIMSGVCASRSIAIFPASPFISCRRISSARPSTSDCPLPSTSRCWAATWPATSWSPPRLLDKIRHVRGAVDVRIQQPSDLPRFEFAIDRTKASELGLAESDIANSVLLNLSGSTQVQPTFWLDSYVGVQYLLNIRVPEYRMTSLSDLNSMPVTAGTPGTGNEQLLANVASFSRTNSQPIYSHYNLCRWSMSLAESAAATSAACWRISKPILARRKNHCRTGVRSCSAARRKPCAPASWTWASAWSWRLR
jgi:hypothetical protein